MPEGVRDVGERDELRPRAEQARVFVEEDLAAVVHRGHPQAGARLLAEPVPGHDVRVVLEPGDDDLVALADVLPAPGLGHEVDGLGAAADVDDLVLGGRVQERLHLLAGVFVGVGGARRQLVGGAVDVRVLVLVEVAEAVDHRLRLLRGGRVVEPDEAAAVDPLLQDREVAPDQLDVEARAERARIRGRRGSAGKPGTARARRRGTRVLEEVERRTVNRRRTAPASGAHVRRGRARRQSREERAQVRFTGNLDGGQVDPPTKAAARWSRRSRGDGSTPGRAEAARAPATAGARKPATGPRRVAGAHGRRHPGGTARPARDRRRQPGGHAGRRGRRRQR